MNGRVKQIIYIFIDWKITVNLLFNIIKILYKICKNDSFIILKNMLQCKLFLKIHAYKRYNIYKQY